jgi:hypothetical protein
MATAKKYVLTPYDAERQLHLVPPPTTPLWTPVLHVEVTDPVPAARRRLDADGRADGFNAALLVRGEVAWRCEHEHVHKAGALECAWQARGVVSS